MVGKLRPSLAATAALLLMSGIAVGQTIVDVYSINYDSAADGPDFPTSNPAIDNDFTRLDDAFTGIASDDTIIQLYGTFDLTEPNAEAAMAASAAYWEVPQAYTGTMIISADSAELIVDPNLEMDNDPYNDKGFMHFVTATGASTYTDFTVDGITFKGFSAPFYVNSSGSRPRATLNDVTIQNCTFYLGSYLPEFSTAWGEAKSSNYNNWAFENNTVYFAVNSGNAATGVGYRATIYGGYFNCCSGNAHKGVSISGNQFLVWADPNMPGSTYPYDVNIRFTAWYDNNGSNRNASDGSETYIENNVFDFGLPDGLGGFQKAYGIGILSTGIDAEIDAVSDGGVNGVYSFNGNEWYNVARAYYPIWFSATDPGDGYVIRNNVFENCGFVDGGNPISAAYPEVTYVAAIQNATAGGFGVSGGSKIIFDLNNEVDGQTGIPMLNDIALDPALFEMEPADEALSAFYQTGILAAIITPPPATTYNRTFDDEWTYEDYLVRPTPPVADGPTDLSAVELAFGYNAFGNAIDPGDPDVFVDDPADPIVVDISIDTEYAPTTIIDKDVTIRRDPGLKDFGAPAAMPVVSPTVRALTDPLFIVKSGGKLTLQNLVIDGNTPFSGVKDINKLVDVEAGGELVLENCTIMNAFAAGVNVVGATLTVTGSKMTNFNPAYRIEGASTAEISDSLFDGVAVGVIAESGGPTISLLRNVWTDVGQEVFYINAPASITLQGNLYFSEFDPYFNGEKFEPGFSETLVNSMNWHNEFYGLPSEEDAVTGLITGNVPVINTPGEIFEDKELSGGVLVYDRHVAGQPWNNSGYIETSIVSRLDRDLDALPDVWELANENFKKFDRDNDGWPDGVEVAEGTDPDDPNDYPAGTFDVAADLDDNGIADWYEAAFTANLGVNPFLGDVLRDGGVGLTDAVRSLQIVNGQFSDNRILAGDHNALDVTANGPNSLSNPLQVLRFQAGVRDVLPALPGTSK